jgi:hypothetical protein
MIEGAAEALRALSSKPYTIKYHLRTLGGPFVRNQTHFSTFRRPVPFDRWCLGRVPVRMLLCTILSQEVHRVEPSRSLSDLRLIYCAGGTAVHMRPIFRDIDPLCTSKSAPSVLALPLGSLRSLKSDRLLAGMRDESHVVTRHSPAVAGGGPVPCQSWKKGADGYDCATDRVNIHVYKKKTGFCVVMCGCLKAFLPWRREPRSGRIAPPTYLIGSPVDLPRSSPAFPVEPRCH